MTMLKHLMTYVGAVWKEASVDKSFLVMTAKGSGVALGTVSKNYGSNYFLE